MPTPTKHLDCSLPQSYPGRAEVPQALAPHALVPHFGWTWVYPIAFSTCGLKCFFRFFASHTQLAESTKKAHPLRLASSTARRSAVRRRAVSCPALQCRAVPRCVVLCLPCFAVLSLSYIPDDNASKHAELTRASMMLSSILYSGVDPSFFTFFWAFFYAVPIYCNSTTAVVLVCTSMLSLNREHSNAR